MESIKEAPKWAEHDSPMKGGGRKGLGVKDPGKWFSFLCISSSQHRLEPTSAQMVKKFFLNQIWILIKM